MSEGVRVSSEALAKIFRRSSRRLLTLSVEGEDELLEMIHRKAAASQDAGKDKLEVTFTHTIKVNFTKGTQTDTLGGSMKVSLRVEGNMDDPDQTEFWGGEEDDEVEE